MDYRLLTTDYRLLRYGLPPMQTWDPALYDARHSFVYKAAAGLLDLLAPRPGERIVDLGDAERVCQIPGQRSGS